MADGTTTPPPIFVELPAARLSVPAQPEGAFPMRHEDWQRIRQRTANITVPTQTFSNIAWAMLGVGAGTVVALLTWLPARSDLPATAWTWVTPALVVIAVAAVAIMAIALAAQKSLQDSATESVTNVLTDMDRVYGPHQDPVQPPAAASP